MHRLDLGFPGSEPVLFDPAGANCVAQAELPNMSYHILVNDTGVLTDPWIKLKVEGTLAFNKPLYFTHDIPRSTASVVIMEM